MTPDFAPSQVRLNSGAGRFELAVGDATAFINFRVLTQGEVGFIHTEVPQELEGQGVGSALVDGALAIVREREWSVLPYCPFVHGWMKRNPEYAERVSYRYPKRDELQPTPAEGEGQDEGQDDHSEGEQAGDDAQATEGPSGDDSAPPS